MSDSAGRRRAIRFALRERRAALADEDQAAASMAVLARLARLGVVRDARIVAGYRAVRGELDIDGVLTLLRESGTTVTVPRVTGEHLEFIEWDDDDPMATGPFGIPEPTDRTTIALSRHDVVLTPLVAFDRDGRRLGQGGGFYDRALSSLGDSSPCIIGIAHSFQEVDRVPDEPWDIPLHAVITEDDVIEFHPGALEPGI